MNTLGAFAKGVASPDLPKEDLLTMYETMCMISSASDRAAAEVRAGRLQSAFYPVRGLEGACAALGVAMQRTDRLVSTYRNLGDALAKGASLQRIMAEIYGRIDGTSKGKGGPMHVHDQSVGFITSTGVVGSGIPIAIGLGLAAQLDAANYAVVTTFGDGATSIGAFHEAMNMAGLWKLPVVFMCQNNQWAEHTPLVEYAASTDLSARADAYAMATVTVDGFDPIATAIELRRALARARAGEGPTFVECITYRLTGHSGSADYSYVPKHELDAALARDPVPSFRKWLRATDTANEQELFGIDTSVAAAVEEAFANAQASPQPPPSELYTDVYADESLVMTR